MTNYENGVPPAASFNNIINNLFQNEKIKYDNGQKQNIVFTNAKLSHKQKQELNTEYPKGFEVLNKFVIYQTNTLENDKPVKSFTQLVSFLRKEGFIYGYYFDVSNIKPFDLDHLKKSKHRIKLSEDAIIKYSNYLEVYHDVNGTSVILSLSNEPLYASLQFSHNKKYYYSSLNKDGIVDTKIPLTKLIGLSRNLKKLNI
jgi:hypothetical protein